MTLDASYWEDRYKKGQTGWDIGYASTPLITYISSLENKNTPILLPGAGNGYEASRMHEQGFSQLTVIDLAPSPLDAIKKRTPGFPDEHLIQGDFFNHMGQYELILEQTFFCALLPHQRQDYAQKMHELLAPGGILAGLLFNFPLTAEGPPFGGDIDEYRALFSPLFNIHTLEPCYNSIKPREGKELFFIFEKN